MDRVEILNDSVETMLQVLDGRQSNIWTAMPGIIKSVDLSKMTCVVQLTIQGQIEQPDGTIKSVDIFPLADVPLVFPCGGGFAVTFPVVSGDEVLVVFASRCIDSWWQSGGFQNLPAEFRMHDLSDGFAIPGPRSVPNVFPSINSSKFQIRNTDGTVYFQIGTKFAMKNATTDLKTILSDLVTDLTTFSAGLNPTTLAAQAAALNTALGLVTTKINALLEAS